MSRELVVQILSDPNFSFYHTPSFMLAKMIDLAEKFDAVEEEDDEVVAIARGGLARAATEHLRLNRSSESTLDGLFDGARELVKELNKAEEVAIELKEKQAADEEAAQEAEAAAQVKADEKAAAAEKALEERRAALKASMEKRDQEQTAEVLKDQRALSEQEAARKERERLEAENADEENAGSEPSSEVTDKKITQAEAEATSVSAIGLPTKIANNLATNGFQTVGQLVTFRDSRPYGEISEIIGPKSSEKIEEAVAALMARVE